MQKNTKNLFLSLLALMLIVSGILMTNPRTSHAATATYKTTASLNVRIGPSASTAKVSTLKKNTVVTKVKASGSWWQIRYNTSKNRVGQQKIFKSCENCYCNCSREKNLLLRN
ncbi:SH3 domain-containing protein [Kurthia senegalensis]|uniref:SH3 domain-containing protein n=1 Tax=Kurthia senegalensis TaxID=1033740 RepID=UPI00028826B5|nr:SH3 domain-containing protein [Kurthia senegalensis]